MKEISFIAHKGAWLPNRRENTVAAIDRAQASKRFEYIEIDVRRTRSDDSGEPTAIVIHDKNLGRLYKQYGISMKKQQNPELKVHRMTPEMLRQDELEIPTLKQAITAAKGHPMNIELKLDDVVEVAMQTVKEYLKKDSYSLEDFVFSSKDWRILRKIKQEDPNVEVALVYGFKNIYRRLIWHIRKLSPKWVGVNKYLAPILLPILILLRVDKRYVYTVNHMWQVKLFSLLGANGFFTDSISLPESVKK